MVVIVVATGRVRIRRLRVERVRGCWSIVLGINKGLDSVLEDGDGTAVSSSPSAAEGREAVWSIFVELRDGREGCEGCCRGEGLGPRD